MIAPLEWRAPGKRVLSSVDGGYPFHGNARGTGSPRGEQALGFLRPAGVEIGLQQSELDQVVLGAAAADAFVLPGERGEGVDRSGKIAAFESGQSPRQRRQIGAGRVASLARHRLHS